MSRRPGRPAAEAPVVSKKTSRLLERYEDDLPLRYSERTVKSYLADVCVFLAWLSSRGVPLPEVRGDDVVSYQNDLYAQRKKDGRPYSVSAQVGRLVALKSLFRFLHRGGYLLQDPSSVVEFPRAERRLPRGILAEDEVRRILQSVARDRTPRGLRDRAMLETLYATGIRVSELANLTPYEIDLEERTLNVVRGKGSKDRNLPLTRAAVEALEAYLVKGRPQLVRKGGGPGLLFLANRGGRMLRPTANEIVRGWAKRAGLTKRVTCHTFRHSVATHLLRGRADIRHIQVLLGHRSLASTERYTRVEIADLREVLKRAHPRGR